MPRTQVEKGKALLARGVVWLARRAETLLAERTTVRGIRLQIFLQEAKDHGPLQAVVAEALDYLHLHGPRHLRRLRRYVRRLAVRTAPHIQGAFEVSDRTIVLAEHFLSNPSVTRTSVASTLVHEIAHARNAGAGIKHTPDHAIRIERLCIREQLWFLRSLQAGDAEPLIAELERRYEAAPSIWSDESRAQRVERALDTVQATGWVRTFVRWLSSQSRAA